MTQPRTTLDRPRLLPAQGGMGRPVGPAEHTARYGPMRLPQGGRAREALIGAVERAGLTGRGGAAFPTARKLRTVAAARKAPVVVANGGEGEPAADKDRTLLMLSPHLVLDGAQFAAAAVGAREIVVCLHRRDAAASVRRALSERAAAAVDPVPVRVHILDDGYVASEETALVRSINGGPGLPMSTPPRPFERGVGGRATLIDNVETLAHLALIARYGPEWFRAAGTPDAPGTALFTIGGAVARPGVYELPLGTPLGELLAAAGGAVEPLQAIMTGGYGGGWLPATDLGLPATQAHFTARGAALGAGIIMALPERACGLAETARVAAWMADQTAGQCGPCIFGLPAVASDLAALTYGGDASRLSARLASIPGRGACRHPDGVVRFAASALRVFADHVREHAHHGPCRASTAAPMLPLPYEPGRWSAQLIGGAAPAAADASFVPGFGRPAPIRGHHGTEVHRP